MGSIGEGNIVSYKSWSSERGKTKYIIITYNSEKAVLNWIFTLFWMTNELIIIDSSKKKNPNFHNQLYKKWVNFSTVV